MTARLLAESGRNCLARGPRLGSPGEAAAKLPDSPASRPPSRINSAKGQDRRTARSCTALRFRTKPSRLGETTHGARGYPPCCHDLHPRSGCLFYPNPIVKDQQKAFCESQPPAFVPGGEESNLILRRLAVKSYNRIFYLAAAMPPTPIKILSQLSASARVLTENLLSANTRRLFNPPGVDLPGEQPSAIGCYERQAAWVRISQKIFSTAVFPPRSLQDQNIPASTAGRKEAS